MIPFNDPTGKEASMCGYIESYCDDLLSASTNDDVLLAKAKIEHLSSFIQGMITAFSACQLLEINQYRYLRDLFLIAEKEARSNLISKFGEESCF